MLGPRFQYRTRGGEPDRDLINDLVEELLQLQAETHPSAGVAPYKDRSSRRALSKASNLVSMLAGWAIDHQAGLRINGTEPWPVPPGGVADDDPAYKAVQEAADDHRHEAAGSEYLGWFRTVRDPKTDRAVLAALLDSLAPAVPSSLFSDASRALRALSFGEVQPLLQPDTTGGHGPAYTLNSCRLSVRPEKS